MSRACTTAAAALLTLLLTVSNAAPVNKTTLLAAVAADVAALKAAGDDGPPPTGTNPPKLALTPLAAAELATDVADAKEAFLDAVTAPKRVAAAAKAAPNASIAVETVKEAALDAALAVGNYKAGLAALPAETAAWAASLKLNGTDDLPSYLGDGKGDARATAAAALVAANGGVVPPGVAALYPGLADWLNAGADLADAGAFNWYASQGAAAGRRRRRLAQAPGSCAAVTLQAFPPTLRTGCPTGSPPPVATRGAGLFAAAPPSSAPLSQTLLMLWLAFFTYVAPDRVDVLWPCASTQGYGERPAVVTAKVTANVTTVTNGTAEVVALVFNTATDVFVAVQGSNSPEDFKIINADFVAVDHASDYNVNGPLKVHRGFHRAAAALWPGINATVQSVVARGVVAPDYSIWFVGHSLGSAIATLTALKYGALAPSDAAPFGGVGDGPNSLLPRVGGVYAFSPPRVGGVSFRDTYNVLLGAVTRRVAYKADLVTAQPPAALGYVHVGVPAGVCPVESTLTTGLERVVVGALGSNAATGCAGTADADGGGADGANAFGFNRHSPALLWDGLLRGAGPEYGADQPALACLAASLAACPGSTNVCSQLLRCDVWGGTAAQVCQSCTRAATCGPSGVLYDGRWQNSAYGRCPTSYDLKTNLFPSTCAA